MYFCVASYIEWVVHSDNDLILEQKKKRNFIVAVLQQLMKTNIEWNRFLHFICYCDL